MKAWIVDSIRNIFTGIRNLIDYVPVVWNDRNYDSAFIFYLLRKKLQRTEKCIRNGCYVGCERDADKIKLCLLLLDRIIDDKYYDNAFKRHTEKWGELTWNFTLSKDRPQYSNVDFTYPNVKTKEEDLACSLESKALYYHSDYMQKQDLEYLFHILNKHILKWWN